MNDEWNALLRLSLGGGCCRERAIRANTISFPDVSEWQGDLIV